MSTPQRHRPQRDRFLISQRQLPGTQYHGRRSALTIPRISTLVYPGSSDFVVACIKILFPRNQLANLRIFVSRPHHSYGEKWLRLSCGTSDHLQITLQCLGAAAAISAPSVPNWVAGYTNGNVGGLIDAMLSPVGKFGKFLMVLLSLSVTATTAPIIYSICIDFQIIIPPLVAVPRYVFSVFVTVL